MRLLKTLRHIKKLDCVKTLKLRHNPAVLGNAKLYVYPKSVVSVSPKARLIIKNGKFEINAKWYSGGKNTSELVLSDDSELVVEGNFALYQGASVYLGPNAKMLIKGGSYINTNSQINCFNYIEIGNGTIVSDDVRIQDSDNHVILENEMPKESDKPIVIGDRCWIGKNAIILKGVTIGNGAVVAAGAVVVRNVPDRALVAGNPAKVIKENVEWR